jgi:hypothetical protein
MAIASAVIPLVGGRAALYSRKIYTMRYPRMISVLSLSSIITVVLKNHYLNTTTHHHFKIKFLNSFRAITHKHVPRPDPFILTACVLGSTAEAT